MIIGVLCHEHGETESESLVKAVVALGHQPVPFTLEEVDFAFDRAGLAGHLCAGLDLRLLDLIISRAKISNDYVTKDTDRYQMLCQLGVPVSDYSTPFLCAESKLATMAVLAKQGIPLPPTRVCQDLKGLRIALMTFGEAVVKPSFGYGGGDVRRVCANTDKSALELLLRRYGQLLVQQYIPHAKGDFRVTIAGQSLLFVARRIPNEKTWKANVSLGADVRVIDNAPPEVCALGLRAADALGLFLAGVDILPFGPGYVVLEVNNCPGWTDLHEPFKAAIAGQIVSRAIDQVVS